MQTVILILSFPSNACHCKLALIFVVYFLFLKLQASHSLCNGIHLKFRNKLKIFDIQRIKLKFMGNCGSGYQHIRY